VPNENEISYGSQERASNRWERLLMKSVDMPRVAVSRIVWLGASAMFHLSGSLRLGC
jgi:hypothetical protein